MRVGVIGGSIAGLSAALFLARAGHDVVVLEGDAMPAPDDMPPDQTWTRKGTPHSRQAHAFLGLFVTTLRERAPDVYRELLAAGVVLRPGASLAPEGMQDLPGIDDLSVINSRRPLVEWVLRRAVEQQNGVELRVGAHVRGLLADEGSPPRVTGVDTADGPVRADVVIDASGRRTQVERWLDAVGAPLEPLTSAPCGMIYVGRYYVLRASDGLPPLNNGFLSAFPYPWGVSLMFPGDNGVMQFAMGVLDEDEEMRVRATTEAGFDAFVANTPHISDWAACGEPVTGVRIMAGLRNYVRRLTRDGEPVVLGLHLAGDAAAITNPQFGRGVSHAIGHAAVIADAITGAPDDLLAQARIVDAEAERMLAASVDDSTRSDVVRTAAWQAGLRGEQPPPPLMGGLPMAQVMAATNADPVVFRAVRASAFMLEPPGSWHRNPDVVARIRATDFEPQPMPPAPSRSSLIEAMDRAI